MNFRGRPAADLGGTRKQPYFTRRHRCDLARALGAAWAYYRSASDAQRRGEILRRHLFLLLALATVVFQASTFGLASYAAAQHPAIPRHIGVLFASAAP